MIALRASFLLFAHSISSILPSYLFFRCTMQILPQGLCTCYYFMELSFCRYLHSSVLHFFSFTLKCHLWRVFLSFLYQFIFPSWDFYPTVISHLSALTIISVLYISVFILLNCLPTLRYKLPEDKTNH